MELFGRTYAATEILYWCVTAICLGTLAFLLIRAYITYFKSGITKNTVHRTLRKMGALRGWKVLRDVSVSFEGESARLDHVVVSPWGVFLFKDIHEKGFYYGNLGDSRWTCTDGEEEKAVNRRTVPNPCVECEKAEALLRRIFAREEIYKMQVAWFVPATGKHVHSYISGGAGTVVTLSELRELLAGSRYEKDNGVDIPRISTLFQS